jgi:hypothetical protein
LKKRMLFWVFSINFADQSLAETVYWEGSIRIKKLKVMQNVIS